MAQRAGSVQRHGLAIVAVAMLTVLAGSIGLGRAASASGPAPAATVTSNGWTTSASTSSSVAPGSTATVRVRVTAAETQNALVDVEIYGAAGQARQQWFDDQSFNAGTRRTFTVSWAVPAGQAPGTYAVKVGVFGSGWSGLRHWNDSAATLLVSTTASTATTAAPTSTTSAPTTTAPASTTTTVRPTTTTTAPTTTTSPVRHFATLPVGAALPSDATCAAQVRPAAEIRPANATFNATKGANLQPQSGLYARVTGNFTGTTDEIIQWAACKWGIDEDVVRAQAAVESWWNQSAGGDWSSDSTHCATGHPIGADGRPGQCPESIGLMQVRYPYWTAAFPSATYSSAYNLDEALAARRSCFEGNETWLNTVERGRDYAAGDLWGCIGLWFSGRWYAGGAQDYIASVQSYYNQRIWESAGFKNG